MELEFPTSINEIEDYLEKQGESTVPMVHSFIPDLADELQHHPFYESALVNWVLSAWHRTDEELFSVQAEASKLAAELTAPLAGRALALLPPGRVKQLDKRSAALLRERLLRIQQASSDFSGSSSAALICVDEQPEAFPRQLYRTDGSLVGWEGFRALVDNLLKVITIDVLSNARLDDRLAPLATILFELFKNTHEHARTWIHDEQFSSSLRGISARFYSTNELQSHLEPKLKGTLTQIDRYCVSLLRAGTEWKGQGARLRFRLLGLIEVSVFDSGPGLAQRWLNGPTHMLPIRDEYLALLECFKKGRSSVPDQRKGFGLWKVLETLQVAQGFVHVRTNRLNLYRDFYRSAEFGMERGAHGRNVPQEQLFDWRKGLTPEASAFPSIRGTSISVVIPVIDR